MNDEAMTYRPLLPLSGSELIDWIALRVRHEALLFPDGGERPSISLSS